MSLGADVAPSTSGGTPAQGRQLRAQGRATLGRLLEAAIVVLDRRGYHGARVDDIVERAGTSHGTFYLYFSSKEDLFRALVADVTEEMRVLAESLPTVGPTKAGYEVLRVWLARFYDIYEHYHPVIRAWTEANPDSPEMAREGALVLRRFVRQLERRIRDVDPPAVPDAAAAALALVSMLERVSYYAVVEMVPVERDVLVDTLARMVHVGVFGGRRRR